MQEWDGKDLNDLPGLVLKHGGSAAAVLGLKKNIVDQQTALQGLQKDVLANKATQNDTALGKIQAADRLKDEELGPYSSGIAQEGRSRLPRSAACANHRSTGPDAARSDSPTPSEYREELSRPKGAILAGYQHTGSAGEVE